MRVSIRSLTTYRHVQQRSHITKEESDILKKIGITNQCDIRHAGKSVKRFYFEQVNLKGVKN